MSKAAMKWFARQEIDDSTLTRLLRVLADAAGPGGRVSVGQAAIASCAGLKERATRSGLALLSQFGVITAEARGSAKGGRLTDRIALSMSRDFRLTKEAIASARRAGCPTELTGISAPVAPLKDTGAAVPVGDAAPSSSEVEGLYIARAHALNFDAATGETLKEASARVWKERGEWRARLTYQGLVLDLGRHECRDLAEAECRVRLLDVAHSLRTKTGTPREPKDTSHLESLHGEALCDFLFGSDEEMGRPTGRAAERSGVRGLGPGQGCGGGSPHVPKEAAASARVRGRP